MVLEIGGHWDAAVDYFDDLHDANCIEVVMLPRWNRPSFAWTNHGSAIDYAPHHKAPVRFLAEPGFSMSEVRNERMLRNLQSEITVPFADDPADGIVLEDFVGGRVNNALVRLTSVDARFPYIRSPLVHEFWVQNFSYSGGTFSLELGGLRARLAASRGDTYGISCKRQLGDFGCAVPLDQASHPHFTVLQASYVASPGSTQQEFTVRFTPAASTSTDPELPQTPADTAAFLADDWFAFGRVKGEQGENQGFQSQIETSTAAVDVGGGQFEVGITLFDPAPFSLNGLERFTLYVGCDKSNGTCGVKFNNKDRFRGQPFLEGTDSLLRRGDSF